MRNTVKLEKIGQRQRDVCNTHNWQRITIHDILRTLMIQLEKDSQPNRKNEQNIE